MTNETAVFSRNGLPRPVAKDQASSKEDMQQHIELRMDDATKIPGRKTREKMVGISGRCSDKNDGNSKLQTETTS